MPLHMRIPKLKGFNNPFRVEYQVVNLDVARGHAASTTSIPEIAARARASSHKGALVKVLGRGELTRSRHRQGPRASPSRPRQPSRRRRYGRGPARCRGATVARPPRATSSPTAERPTAARPSRADQELSPVLVQPAEHLPGPRPAEQDPVHARSSSCSTGSGAHLPVPGHRPRRRSRTLQEQRRDSGGVARLPRPVLRRRDHQLRDLRPRDHAVHHGVDHHADPRRGDPQARAVAATRARSARARSPSGRATSPSASRSCSRPASCSCSTTAAAACSASATATRAST